MLDLWGGAFFGKNCMETSGYKLRNLVTELTLFLVIIIVAWGFPTLIPSLEGASGHCKRRFGINCAVGVSKDYSL